MTNYLDDILSGGGGPATAIATTGGTPVSVTAPAPATGQFLRATSPTSATWQTLETSGNESSSFPLSPDGVIGSDQSIEPNLTYLVVADESNTVVTLSVPTSETIGFAVKAVSVGPSKYVAVNTSGVDIEHQDGTVSSGSVFLSVTGDFEEFIFDQDGQVYWRKQSVTDVTVTLGGDLAGTPEAAQVRALTDGDGNSYPIDVALLDGQFLKVEDGGIVGAVPTVGDVGSLANEAIAALQFTDTGDYTGIGLGQLFWLRGSIFGSAGNKVNAKISTDGGNTWAELSFDETPLDAIRGMAANDDVVVCVGTEGQIEVSAIDPDSFIDEGTSFTDVTAAAAYADDFFSVVWTGTAFLALGAGNQVQRLSADGLTVSSVLSAFPSGGPADPGSFQFSLIASSGGTTVIAGNGGGGANNIQIWFTEDDGGTWTYGGGNSQSVVAYIGAGQLKSGAHGFVVTGDTTFLVATDADLTAWTDRFNAVSNIEDGLVLFQDGVALVTDFDAMEASHNLVDWYAMPAQELFSNVHTECGFTLLLDVDQHLQRSLPTVPSLGAGGGITAPETTVNGHLAIWSGTEGDALLDSGTAVSDLVPGSRTITAGVGLAGGGDLSANRTLSVNFGSSSTTACAGNDPRLSNDRRAASLKSLTTTVVIDTAAAPSAGQVLTAINSTSASWATPAVGGGGSTAEALGTSGADVLIGTASPPVTGYILTATSPTTAAWAAPAGGGSGDFVGPAISTIGNLVSFGSGTGKLGADSGIATTSIVQTSRTITAGTGLSGGGDLSANRTLSVDTSVIQVARTVVTISTNTTAVVDRTYLVDSTSGTITVTLPAAASSSGKELVVKRKTGSNSVVIDGNGAETIDGAATLTLAIAFEWATLTCDGSAWFQIS